MSLGSVEGLLLVDKPSGITSHDVVAMVRRATQVKKVGHAGTLDPMATGLLVLGLGRATRLLRFLGDLPKTYEGTFRLGVETTTLDAEGDVTGESPVAVTDAEIVRAMAAKLGESWQRPPAFSAVKVGGRKLYDAARRGEVLRAEPRSVTVDRPAGLSRFRTMRSTRAWLRPSCSARDGTRALTLTRRLLQNIPWACDPAAQPPPPDCATAFRSSA